MVPAYTMQCAASGSDGYGSDSRIKTSMNQHEDDPPTRQALPPPPSEEPVEAPTEPPLAGDGLPREFSFEILLNACNKVIEVHEEQKRRDSDLLDEKGRFAGLLDRRFDRFADKLEPRFAKLEGKIERLEKDYADLKAATDKRFSELAAEIQACKEQRDAARSSQAEAAEPA